MMEDEDALVADEATEERVIQFIELSPTDQILALALLSQAKKLRKVCPDKIIPSDCNGNECLCKRNWDCHGTGSIPVGPEDVEVRVKC